MKKVYSKPEWQLDSWETEDVITASNDGTYSYGSLDGDCETWEW